MPLAKTKNKKGAEGPKRARVAGAGASAAAAATAASTPIHHDPIKVETDDENDGDDDRLLGRAVVKRPIDGETSRGGEQQPLPLSTDLVFKEETDDEEDTLPEPVVSQDPRIDAGVSEPTAKKAKVSGEDNIESTECTASYGAEKTQLRKVHIKGKRWSDKHCLAWGLYDQGDYEGEINEKGERHGRGTMRFSDSGEVYKGEWENNEMHGEGKLYRPDINVYKGTFKEGRLHGKVSFETFSALAGKDSKFEGDFIDGMTCGTCKYEDRDYCCISEIDGHSELDRDYCCISEIDGHSELEGPYFCGRGVGWNSKRTKAWRMKHGRAVESISLTEAKRIAKSLGVSLPRKLGRSSEAPWFSKALFT